MPNSVFSTPLELEALVDLLIKYMRLPFFRDKVPGAILEGALAHVRGADVLDNYDFVDVVNRDAGTGWQVKSTKESTPLTWMRAKIPGRNELIAESHRSEAGLRALGDTIIKFANNHVLQSITKYGLSEIGYSRLIVHKSGQVTYFERLLCSKEAPRIFEPSDFDWRWSTAKNTNKKEQLSALHGVKKSTSKGWWAWHGQGENQLHFKGEREWWPSDGRPHTLKFYLPPAASKLSLAQFAELLAQMDESI